MADASATRELVRRWANEVVLIEAQPILLGRLQEAAPLGQTGETRRGVEVIQIGGGDRPALLARSTGKGGDFVESGTAPHDIFPRNAKALRFLAGSGRISQAGPNQRIATTAGGVAFAKVVHHPGTPARPWFRPTVQEWPDILEAAAARVRV